MTTSQATDPSTLRASTGSAAPRDRPHAGWTIALVVLAVGLLANAIEAALHFGGPPLDGPFQLFNALRRIGDGQRLGSTFEFFHGPGVPYLYYIPFALGGKNLLASELARELLSVVLILIVTP